MRKQILFLIFLISISLVSALPDFTPATYQSVGSSINTQYYQPGLISGSGWTSSNVYWSEFDSEVCRNRQDFIVQIAPGGCQPAVVRSDLLEERNVPVFCKMMLVQTNPLIDVSRVKTIRFSGKTPKEVAGITYFPPRYYDYANRRDVADTPIDDNIGYFVVSLRKTPNEDDMPDWVEGDLTAVIDYDIENAFGTGRTSFYVSEISEEDWLRDYKFYSFWNGKGYIKTESVESDQVTVSIYRDFDTREDTLTLKKGQTSDPIYLGGFYCAAGLTVKVEDIDVPVESALLQIDDDQTWVSKGDRILDSQCRVVSVDTFGGGGKVKIDCPISDGDFYLTLNPTKVDLDLGEGEKEYSVGDKIDEETYLAYAGLWKDQKEDAESQKFVVIVKDPWVNSEAGFQDRSLFNVIERVVERDRSTEFKDLKSAIEKVINLEYNRLIKDTNKVKEGLEITIILGGEEGEISSKKIKLSNEGIIENAKPSNDLAYEYYKKAIENYIEVADFYPEEKVINDVYEKPYAAQALANAAKLAGDFEMLEDREEFLKRLRDDYPDSRAAKTAENNIERSLKYDTKESRAVVNLRDGSYFVQVLDFKKPTKEERSVDLSIDGIEETLGLGGIKELKKDSKVTGTIQVTDIKEDRITIKYDSSGEKTTSTTSRTATLDLENKQQTSFGDTTIKLLKINLKEQAKLVLDSEVTGPKATANFSFKIGIEKRGIDLSPEKTQEMIDNIGEHIEKWTDVNEKLGKVVKGLKSACFATAAVLNVKNLVTGMGGDSMARNEIMTSPNGWNDWCEDKVSSGQYYNVQACLLDKNDKIETDVQLYAAAIKETNNKLEQARSGLVEREGLDFEGYVTDQKKMESEFRNSITCTSEMKGSFSADCDKLDFDSTKRLYTINNALSEGGSEALQDSLQAEKQRIVDEQQAIYDYDVAIDKAKQEALNLGMKLTSLESDNIVYGEIHKAGSSDGFVGTDKVTGGESLIAITVPKGFSGAGKDGKGAYDIKDLGNTPILIQVQDSDGNGIYTQGKDTNIYTKDGTKLETNTPEYAAIVAFLSQKKATQFKQADSKAYINKMTNPENLKVKYFETAPYKGLPSEVPFDIRNGWYVETEYVISGFGQPYDESGRLVNFYICNVGPNGKIEFKRQADDICRYYNGVSDELGFPGMTSTESRKLVSDAKQAIAEASKYYGKEKALINGNYFKTGKSSKAPSGRCSDFMSPKDCQLMFNVCDPVICPASRCDLGGAFPVDDVIQTGIIGSLVLCLPNINEGVYVPVCLSGVHAGIEGYLSILQAHRDCLNESLTSGRTIGICDEIYSIYLCEFFWKNAAPFANLIIPKLIESLAGQGVRGGGEYLTVQSAWDNTQSSVNYFTDQYAVNSMTAFQARSTEEAGTEICKSFISTRYPTNLDLLTEPDSPSQYHAWFDENIMTTATPYPTSHYKVYYHIYAGEDQGTYYTVYLKDISEDFTTKYTYQSGNYVVPGATGYIAAGDFVDIATDFTGPSGYQQLCIRINGQDECGFGKVSTSFAVNYLTDLYVEDQIEQDITKSSECVAGTPSLYSLAQPNLQAGAEEIVSPELYNQGIVRVCASYNPGKQVDSSGEYDKTNLTHDRWKDVGYCDDPTIRCWLDTESVKDVVNNKNLTAEILEQIDINNIEGGYLTEAESMSIINSENKNKIIDSSIKNLNKNSQEADVKSAISELEQNFQKLSQISPANPYRASGFFLLGNLYDKVARKLNEAGTTPGPNPPDKTGQTGGAPAGDDVDDEDADNQDTTDNPDTGDDDADDTQVDNYGTGDMVIDENKVVWTKENDGFWTPDEGGAQVSYDEIENPEKVEDFTELQDVRKDYKLINEEGNLYLVSASGEWGDQGKWLIRLKRISSNEEEQILGMETHLLIKYGYSIHDRGVV